MVHKKKMATTKKRTKQTGKVIEFFSAIFGFWPVWLSVTMIVAVFFSYEYYNSVEMIEISQEITITTDTAAIDPDKIRVEGTLQYIDRKSIQKFVSEKLQQGYLGSNLIEIREHLEAEPWIKGVIIKRLPPDILQVEVMEKVPMLRWKNRGLISQQGELFFPENINIFAALAVVDSEKQSIQLALELLTNTIPVLKNIKLKLKSVSEDELGAWEIQTVQGVELKLGRNNFQHRLNRLKILWFSALQKGSVKTVDLRYTNGAAVSYLEANG